MKDRILQKVRTLWEEMPEQRLAQLLMNVAGDVGSPYYVEDEELEEVLDEWIEGEDNSG